MRARIIGAGSYIPENVVSNEMLAKIIPEWSADIIEKKLGIVERRFMWPLDMVKGKTVPPRDPDVPATSVDMSKLALGQALDHAGIKGSELDAILFVTCTPDEPLFSHDAMALHEHFGLPSGALVNEFESGCGGAVYQFDFARRLVESGMCKRVALVASNATSPCFTGMHIYSDPAFPFPFDPDKPLKMALSAYVFGDGAGAVILDGGGDDDHGVINSHVGVDYGVHVFRSGGGILWPGNADRTENWRHGYYVDGLKVAIDYAKYIQAGVVGAMRGYEDRLSDIDRFFFHQVNRRILEKFLVDPFSRMGKYASNAPVGLLEKNMAGAGFPMDKVSIHVDRYANVSAACTLVLMAEDLHSGVVQLGSSELVLLAAMGAGVHYGGHLIRL